MIQVPPGLEKDTEIIFKNDARIDFEPMKII
jgi:hypothetical protein